MYHKAESNNMSLTVTKQPCETLMVLLFMSYNLIINKGNNTHSCTLQVPRCHVTPSNVPWTLTTLRTSFKIPASRKRTCDGSSVPADVPDPPSRTRRPGPDVPDPPSRLSPARELCDGLKTSRLRRDQLPP